MKLNYALEESDFLAYQMFTAFKSESVQKKKRYGWLFLTLIGGVLTLFCYAQGIPSLIIYFGIVTLLTALFYGKYFNWRYRRHYTKHIKEHYTQRIGVDIEMDIQDDYIFSKDKTGEGKLNISEIEVIHETPEHLFIQISNGVSWIMPKAKVGNIIAVKNKFQEIDVLINDELNWKMP